MKEIKDDLKHIKSELVFIRVETAKNSVSLENHMARTAASEKRLEKLEYVLIGLFASAVFGGLIKLLIS